MTVGEGLRAGLRVSPVKGAGRHRRRKEPGTVGTYLQVCPKNKVNVRQTGLMVIGFQVGVTCPQVTLRLVDCVAVTRRRVTGTEALNKLKSPKSKTQNRNIW